MSDELRIGVVGVRNIGCGHIKRAAELAGVRVAAIADPDAERRSAVAGEHGIETAYAEAGELFADETLDAVVLAVPNHLHAPFAVEALEAGKHVLVEKPISRSPAEAEEMIRARDAAGRVLMVGMNQRFNPKHYALRRLVAEGALGDFQFGRTWWRSRRVHEGLWGRGDWFLSRENSGGGPLADLGVHRLDLALFLLGFPVPVAVDGACFYGIGEVEARERGKVYEIEDSAVGMIRFQDGSVLELEASYFQNTPDPGQGTVLLGTRGSLDPGAEPPLVRHTGAGTEPLAVEPDASAPRSPMEHFARVIRGEEELCSTAEQALVSMRIIDGLYASAGSGEPVLL
jgi:predicted dehydrogenase